MAVVLATDLLNCAGVPLTSPDSSDTAPQVPDHQAVLSDFIPADACSAILISPRRVIVTGGTLPDDRVLPFTVLRYLDIDSTGNDAHKWVKPLLLRSTPKRPSKRRRNAENTIPVCRMDHTLTLVPEVQQLLLLGGIKVGGKDEGTACKSMFYLDLNIRQWESVDLSQVNSRSRSEREQVLGPCFAHVAVHLHTLRSESRPRKASGYVLVHGGYSATNNAAPRSHIHIYDVRARRWALRTPAGGISPPQRAYHAAAVTESCRYFILHGGTCSNINEPTFMSSDLYVFDMVTSEWCRPKLTANSAPPPAPRSKHSLVKGIGPHAGKLVMYGGFVGSGESSCDMFTVTIIEPSSPDQPVSVQWEKLTVVTPSRSLGEPSSSRSSGQGLNDTSSPAIYGGSLIPVPVINKYIVIGGRGPYGIRNAPLSLDANHDEHLDRLIGKTTTVASNPGQASAPIMQSQEDSPAPVSLRLRIKIDSDSEITGAVAAQHKQDRQGARSGSNRQVPQMPPPKKSGHRAPVSGGIPHASLQVGQGGRSVSLEQPVLAEGEKIAEKANESLIEQSMDLVPEASVHPKSASPLAKKDSANGMKGDERTGKGNNADNSDLLLNSKDISKVDSSETITPPTKRRRFTERIHRDLAQKPVDVDAIESTPELLDSGGSGFVSASDFAKRAAPRRGRSGRGRGRGRAVGTSRSRAAIVAEEREERRASEEEEKNRENARLVTSLKEENEKLKMDKADLIKDNKDLNEQMKSLLFEVQALRGTKKETPAHDRGPQTPINLGSGDGSGTGRQGTRHASNHNRMSVELEKEEMIRNLESKVSDLQEECQEVMGERDAACKAQKAIEENKRALESELNVLKNKFARLETEKDQLRRQANELRTTIAAASSAQDSANEYSRKVERENSVMSRALETVRYSLRDLEQRRNDEKLELSSALRKADIATRQLMAANRKCEEAHSSGILWRAQLVHERHQSGELKKQVDLAQADIVRLNQMNASASAELGVLKSDFESKVRDWKMSLADLERARSALAHERQRAVDFEIEVTRLRRKLEGTEKEHKALSDAMSKREKCLKSLKPAVALITRALGFSSEASVGVESVQGDMAEVGNRAENQGVEGEAAHGEQNEKLGEGNGFAMANGREKSSKVEHRLITEQDEEVIEEGSGEDEDMVTADPRAEEVDKP